LWNVKTNAISVIMGNWIHLRIVHKQLSDITGKHEIRELEKTAILGTAHTLENTNVKYKRYNIVNNTTCATQNSCNTVVPRNMVCFRYISVNNLHKGNKTIIKFEIIVPL
jgi:hypothetical protein